jgi:hypothetical protein
MSLDKFVMRGFTSSAGSGDGSWVGRAGAPDTAPQKTEGSGSTFVLGGSAGLMRTIKAQGPQRSAATYRDHEHSFDQGELLNYGAGGRRSIPPNCLGGGRGGGGSSQGFNSNAVVGVWLALAAAVVMFLILSQSHSNTVATEWRERRSSEYYDEEE